MKNQRNYYRILHVQPDAPLPVIRMSYRTIMQKLRKHPDLGGDEWNAGVINEAYAVLSDHEQRCAYDAILFAERSKAETAHQDADQRTKGAAENERTTQTEAPAEHEGAEKPSNSTQQQKGPSVNTAANDNAWSPNHCAFCNKAYLGLPDVDSDCANCSSPLLRLTPQQLETTCQRHIQRMPVSSMLTIHHSWPVDGQSGELNNMSLNGLQFSSKIGLRPGGLVRISGAMFIAVAEIINSYHADATTNTYGARFVTLRFSRQSGTFVATSV
ncbi:MAG: DnaJ domain-containing protein [Pseudomonadales bacterium]